MEKEQALITITTTAGARHELRIEHCAGSLERPLTDAELDAKFLALAEPALSRRAAEALQALRGLATAANIADIARSCAST